MSNKEAINLIKKYLDEYTLLEEYSFNGDIFHEIIKLGEKEYNIGGVFFQENPNLLANYVFKNYSNIDILLLINPKDKIVILRKSIKCDIDLGKLAKQLSTGGGKNKIAGCLLNDKILNLTKLLKPLN